MILPNSGLPAQEKNNPGLQWLALGDSYTIGESVGESDRYPVQAVRILAKAGILFNSPEIIARTGWTTGDLLAALDEKKISGGHYSLVTLLIGVNNQYQGLPESEYREQFRILLQRAVALADGKASRVIVLSIPDYAVTPFARHLDTALISKQIDSFNRINREETRAAGADWLDITGESRKAAGDPARIAGDGLHFSGKEYAVWAQLLANRIQEKTK